jgi:GNAT superfamily N-acetyltransferase
MSDADVPLGMRLKSQAGFNQTEADWQRFLDLEPGGCFVAELDGEPVGTAIAFVFDSIGWIAMLLVDEPVRGRGVGTRLTEHALAYLDAHGVRTARLDATPRGRPIYEKLGFVAEYELVRLEGVAVGGTRHDAVATLPPERLDAVVALDEEITGTSRRRLIEGLCRERPEATWVFPLDDEIAGYLTIRDGSNAVQIGPGAALSEGIGCRLGDAAMAHCEGQRVCLDIPTENVAAVRWAESKRLSVQRSFTRMRRGEPVLDRPSQLWASSGPEKG